MKIKHCCSKNPSGVAQEYELSQPTGLNTAACHCGWCGFSYRLANSHCPAEGYGNPFDERGSFVPTAAVGKFMGKSFYPVPKQNGEWSLEAETRV